MAEKLNWNYVVQALNGPSLSAADELVVDEYDKMEITIAATVTQQIDLVPNADMALLIIQPEPASNALSCEITGYDVMLEGPQVFIGSGAVRRRGGATSLKVTNHTGADAVIGMLTGRDATP